MIHQEPQLDEKTGLNFSEAWPSLQQFVSGKNCGLWLRRIADNSWVLTQVFEFSYKTLKTQHRLKSSVLIESWDNNISPRAAVCCSTWKRPNIGRLPSEVLWTIMSQVPLSSHNGKIHFPSISNKMFLPYLITTQQKHWWQVKKRPQKRMSHAEH